MTDARSRPIRVVLDTNVLVAALLWDGLPRKLFEAVCAAPGVTVVVSPEMLAELDRVLRRPRFAARIRATGWRPDELIARYRLLTAVITPRTVARIVLADEDDDHVLALAIAAGASLIVTGDKSHLLPIGRHEGIAIITPRQAWEMLGTR